MNQKTGNTEQQKAASDHRAYYFTLIYVFILIGGVTTCGVVLFSFELGRVMNERYSRLVDATLELRNEASMAHLWFEEILAGDTGEDIRKVWDLLDSADGYARILIEGGTTDDGYFEPVDDPEMLEKAQEITDLLSELRDIIKQRYADIEHEKAGTDLDARNDEIFNAFLRDADLLESRLYAVIDKGIGRYNLLEKGLLLLCICMTLSVLAITMRSGRRIRAAVKEMDRSNLLLREENRIRRDIQKDREMLISDLEKRQEELERFTYTVSHDLKSPLITIKGFLGVLREDAEKDDHELMASDMSRIESAADRMQDLLDELLELSRVGRIVNPPEEISFEELTRQALELTDGGLKKRGISVETDSDGTIIKGDVPRLREVMQNLIDNAIKYSSEKEPRIRIGIRRENGSRIFYVSDNGVGIEEAYCERVFNLFEQLDPSYEGTGIGLSLVKRIVEFHGGRIWVESAGRGHGSTFCFTLEEGSETTEKENEKDGG